MVEPRHRGSFQDKALLLVPDATGGGNPDTRLLAGAGLGSELGLTACSRLGVRDVVRLHLSHIMSWVESREWMVGCNAQLSKCCHSACQIHPAVC